MKTITIPVNKFVVTLEEGETITNGKPCQGQLTIDEAINEAQFRKNKKKEKTATKNPPHFTGDYMTLRLNKDSQFRLTMLLAYDTKVSEIRSQLCSEFNKMLDSMPH